MKFCKRCGGFFDDDVERCPDDGGELAILHDGNAETQDPLIGQVLDRRYRVLSRLGAGGMGAVYRALQTSTRREVALKVIRGDLAQEGTKRFMVEAHTTSALRNVHTVTIFDFGQAEDGMLYLAMELLEGSPLDAALSKSGAMPWSRALHICSQIAESLAEAHAKDIVHRDLKPANIFLTTMGTDKDFVKVLDFGIAKLQSGGLTTNLTGTGMVLGTPRYMSPEQARGEELGPSADLYSLGVVLFELLTGRPPFDSDQAISLMMKHCQDPVPPVREIHPAGAIPASVETLVSRLLAKDPADRVESAIALKREIVGLLSGEISTKTPGSGLTVPAWAIDEEAPTEMAHAAPPSAEHESTAAVQAADAAGSRRSVIIALVVALLLGGGVFAATRLLPGDEASSHEAATAGSRPKPAPPGESAVVSKPRAPTAEPPAPAAAVQTATATSPDRRTPMPANDAALEPNTTATDMARPSVSAPKPETAPKETVAATTVLVSTAPAGATVVGPGGENLGTTPLALPTPKKTTKLTLRRNGYATMPLSLVAGTEGKLELKLKRKRRRRRPTPTAKDDGLRSDGLMTY